MKNSRGTKGLSLLFLLLSLVGVYLFQWVFFFNRALVVLGVLVGAPFFAYIIWRDVYSSGRSGTKIQQRVGPLLFSCFCTPGPIIILAFLNQQTSHQAELVKGTLVSGEYSSLFEGHRITVVEHTKINFTLEGSTDVLKVRAPGVYAQDFDGGLTVYVCRQKGLLFMTYFEIASLGKCG